MKNDIVPRTVSRITKNEISRFLHFSSNSSIGINGILCLHPSISFFTIKQSEIFNFFIIVFGNIYRPMMAKFDGADLTLGFSTTS